MGGDTPVVIQSMTNTDTNNIKSSVDQCIRMIKAGAQLIRLTTQGSKEVESLAKIREALRGRGFSVPLAADIHFRPKVALEAAQVVEKIRINPGNYLKGSDLESLLSTLLKICKENEAAIRIGVNHGSLDENILQEFGDTPEGMVESAMSFLRVCKKEHVEAVVVSMKSSNPRVMVYAVRLLAKTMQAEQMDYPIHLGVTEAGDGLDGIIKSALGMAPLLLEGLGDTIRVSLTAPPEEELPIAKKIIASFPKPAPGQSYCPEKWAWDPHSFQRRKSRSYLSIGGGSRVKIISPQPPVPGEDLQPSDLDSPGKSSFLLLEKNGQEMNQVLQDLNEFCLLNSETPVIYKAVSTEKDPELFAIQMAGELGAVLLDGAIDAVWLENPHLNTSRINDLVLNIFQASGARITKTEYIACPGCGRTHFDLVSCLQEIREATAHLKPVKIGVMGCIVNGPGEMADADYGYVGAGRGRVDLYKGKTPILKNIPEKQALSALIDLMKEEGDWQDPPAKKGKH